MTCASFSKTPRSKLRVQLVGVVVLYGIAMAVRVWRLWGLDTKPVVGGYWFPLDQVGVWLVGYLDWFALGMLLAIGSAWVANGGRIPMLGRALARYPAASWLLALTCFWVALPHPKMHLYRQQGAVWRLAEGRPAPRRHSPLFGEHNAEILQGLLGVTDEDMTQLTSASVVADAPINPSVG